jgi:hypothetical protein
MIGLRRAGLLHLLVFHLLIHPDGNIWIDGVVKARYRTAAGKTRRSTRFSGRLVLL